MKRLLINGSPRGKKSNTTKILSWVAEGMLKVLPDVSSIEEIPVIYLARIKDIDKQKNALLQADEIVFAMPLYTDSMPGIVKNFIDSLADIPIKKLAKKRVAFIVQSGFPESIHSETLAAYFERLTHRLDWFHAGTIIKGGMEGIQIMPDRMIAKVRKRFRIAGFSLVHDGIFDPVIIKKMARPRKFGFIIYIIFAIMKPFGGMNMYWNMMLKKNNAYSKRFDAPYGKAFGEK